MQGMGPAFRRLVIVAMSVAAIMATPASAAADCNGPGCEPPPPVEGLTIVATFAIVMVFAAIMAVAEVRRR